MKQFYDQAFQQALMADSDSSNGKAVVRTFHETVRLQLHTTGNYWGTGSVVPHYTQTAPQGKRDIKFTCRAGSEDSTALLVLRIEVKQVCSC